MLLAKGALRKGDWAAASDYAMKATQASSFNFDAWLVRIVAARRRGDVAAARRILRLARQVAPLFHGARFEEKLIGDSDTAGFTFHVRNEFPEQTYLDLADWYEDAGLLDEARELYGLAPKNILAQVRRAYLERCAGKYEAAARALEEAAKLSVRFMFPFRRATRAALAWAAESDPYGAGRGSGKRRRRPRRRLKTVGASGGTSRGRTSTKRTGMRRQTRRRTTWRAIRATAHSACST